MIIEFFKMEKFPKKFKIQEKPSNKQLVR